MKNFLLVILLSLAIMADLKGQYATLPFAARSNDLQPTLLAPDTIKYRRALSIFEKLVEARGDSRYPAPKFIMTKQENQVAWMNYDSLMIGLEEKAFDVCMRYPNPDAALALLIGHELTHYYEKHAWRRGFVSTYRKLKIGVKFDTVQDDITYETQADYLGGFLAYSAGFGIFLSADTLLRDLYKAYELPSDNPGYPILADRMQLWRTTRERLERLIDVFEMANLLTAAGLNKPARTYYQYILKDFQSPEIYNNIGINALLEAVAYFDDLKFRYPLEIDLKSRASRSGEDVLSKRKNLLREGIRNFDFAIGMDPNYAPAYLNKACAYSLLGQPQDIRRAQFYAEIEGLEKVANGKNPKIRSDLYILLGILAHQRGDVDGALQAFEAAKPNALAVENISILLNQKVTQRPNESLQWTETIDDTSLPAFAMKNKYDSKRKIELDENTIFYQYSDPKPGVASRILFSQDKSNNRFVYFNVTQPGYSGKTAGEIGIGASEQEILEIYQLPLNTLETPSGRMLVYQNIIFILDQQGKLKRWANYLIK